MSKSAMTVVIVIALFVAYGPVHGQIYSDQDTMSVGGEFGGAGVSGEPGDTIDVFFYFANPTVAVGGYQIRILYVDSVMTAIGGEIYGRGSVLEATDFSFSDSDVVLVLGYSWAGNTISRGTGSVAVIQFEIDPEAELEIYPIDFVENDPDIVNVWTDSSGNNLIVPIMRDGYVNVGLNSGCDYITGNVNGSGLYDGLDITFGVNYFKGGGPAPFCPHGSCPIPPCNTFFYCGDVNGDCRYDGLDITYGVAYFKGGPEPVPCPDCTPAE